MHRKILGGGGGRASKARLAWRPAWSPVLGRRSKRGGGRLPLAEHQAAVVGRLERGDYLSVPCLFLDAAQHGIGRHQSPTAGTPAGRSEVPGPPASRSAWPLNLAGNGRGCRRWCRGCATTRPLVLSKRPRVAASRTRVMNALIIVVRLCRRRVRYRPQVAPASNTSTL